MNTMLYKVLGIAALLFSLSHVLAYDNDLINKMPTILEKCGEAMCVKIKSNNSTHYLYNISYNAIVVLSLDEINQEFSYYESNTIPFKHDLHTMWDKLTEGIILARWLFRSDMPVTDIIQILGHGAKDEGRMTPLVKATTNLNGIMQVAIHIGSVQLHNQDQPWPFFRFGKCIYKIDLISSKLDFDDIVISLSAASHGN